MSHDTDPNGLATVERVSRWGAALKTIVTVVVSLVIGLSTAVLWARGKAEKSDVAQASSVAAAVDQTLQAQVHGIAIELAHVKGQVDTIAKQNDRILSAIEGRNRTAAARGETTPYPIQGGP